MAHTFTNLLTHAIFSTKDRAPLIDGELKARLFPYIIGILRELKVKTLAINGVDDHVHLLFALPPAHSVADVMRVLKTNSSRWVNETSTTERIFGWQSGYGAFSVSQSNVVDVVEYIRGQEEHHRKRTFQEEFVVFLKKQGIEYDERYIWE
ncbi:MAG TPA: IS200/IS605 family transposase [Pyrinomonadaceae bacterium]